MKGSQDEEQPEEGLYSWMCLYHALPYSGEKYRPSVWVWMDLPFRATALLWGPSMAVLVEFAW